LIISGLLFADVLIPIFVMLDLAAEARDRGANVALIVTLGILITVLTSMLGLFIFAGIYSWLHPRTLPPR
jgi:hypothetical protein